MRRSALAALLPLVMAGTALAQGNTEEQLQQAARYHAALMSSASRHSAASFRPLPFVVTHDQRVLAYKYLGAALVCSANATPGSASGRRWARSVRDLEPQTFTPAEIAAFSDARRLTFGLGIRPIAFDTIDPRTERLSVTVLTTHGADVRVELRSAGAPAGLVLFVGITDGPRELRWDGLLADAAGRNGTLRAAVGRHQPGDASCRPGGCISASTGSSATEDTVAALAPGSPARQHPPRWRGRTAQRSRRCGRRAARSDRGRKRRPGRRGRAAAVGIAVTASVVRDYKFHLSPKSWEVTNIAANAERRAQRVGFERRDPRSQWARLTQTRLIVTPGAGVGP